MLKTIFIFLFTLCTAVSASAQSQEYVVNSSTLPPFSFQDAEGVAQGISVDVLLKIMSMQGQVIKREDIGFIAWPRAMERTKNESNHILLSPARTPERERLFKWVGPVHSLKLGLIARKDSSLNIKTAADLVGLKIASIRDSAPIAILKEKFGVLDEDIIQVTDDKQQMAMLDLGRVDLVTHVDMAVPVFMTEMGLDAELFEMVHVLRDLELYIAFNPQADDLFIERLNKSLEQIKAIRADGRSYLGDIVAGYVAGGPMPVRQAQ